MCVTPGGHGIGLAAAGRGIPFLVENPLAVEWDTAARIADAVATADLITAVGYQWWYLRTTEQAREVVAAYDTELYVAKAPDDPALNHYQGPGRGLSSSRRATTLGDPQLGELTDTLGAAVRVTG